MKKIMTSAALGTLGALMLAGPALAAHEGSTYAGDLNSLNNEPGSGSATIEVSQDGESMTVDVTASNLELDFPHAMHIHGIYDGDLSDDPADGAFSASSCPDFSDDANEDGILTVAEGAADYGGVLLSLTTEGDTSADSALAVERFPAGTSIDYSREVTIPSAMKDELSKIHIVVHGTDTDDSGDVNNDVESSLDPSLPVDATAPALCGTMTVTSAGAVQTGAGGTATTDSGTAAVAAGAAALLGAVALRRRYNS